MAKKRKMNVRAGMKRVRERITDDNPSVKTRADNNRKKCLCCGKKIPPGEYSRRILFSWNYFPSHRHFCQGHTKDQIMFAAWWDFEGRWECDSEDPMYVELLKVENGIDV